MGTQKSEFPLASPPTSNMVLDGYIASLKIGLSMMVPVWGGAIAEGLGAVVGYQGKVTLERWLEDLHRRFLELGDRVSSLEDPEKAREIAAFIISAGQTAAKSHQDEKFEALKAAILNSALDPMHETDQRATFLRFIEELTPTHLRMLRIISENPHDYDNITTYSIIFKRLQSKGMGLPADDDCYLYFRELVNRDLISTNPKLGSVDEQSLTNRERLSKEKEQFKIRSSWRAVALSITGDKFMRFITDPLVPRA